MSCSFMSNPLTSGAQSRLPELSELARQMDQFASETPQFSSVEPAENCL